MKIRKAEPMDVPFIVNAILEIEKSGDSNTYNNLFSTETSQTKDYLHLFFSDEENKGTELSLDTFCVAEENGILAGCSSLITTNHDYYLNKGEIFAIHLSPEHLQLFIKNVSALPDQGEESKNKQFVEYIFVDEKFRRKGIAEQLINYQIGNSKGEEVFINVFTGNEAAYRCYTKLGFNEYTKIRIDSDDNKIYPTTEKIVLSKKI